MLNTLTIIIPIYNEEGNLAELLTRLSTAIEKIEMPTKVLAVDDCSTDNSYHLLQQLKETMPELEIIRCEKNEGQASAMCKGIALTQSSHIAFMDADLQNDPESLISLVAKCGEYDVVFGIRADRKDDLLYTLPSVVGNLLLSLLFGVRITDSGCSLRVGKTKLFKPLPYFSNCMVYWNLFIKRAGFKTIEVSTKHNKRFAGVSHYSRWKFVKTIPEMIYARIYYYPKYRSSIKVN